MEMEGKEHKENKKGREVRETFAKTGGAHPAVIQTLVCVYTGNVEMRATPPVCVCNCTSDTPGIYICDRATAASLQTNVSELRGVYTTL